MKCEAQRSTQANVSEEVIAPFIVTVDVSEDDDDDDEGFEIIEMKKEITFPDVSQAQVKQEPNRIELVPYICSAVVKEEMKASTIFITLEKRPSPSWTPANNISPPNIKNEYEFGVQRSVMANSLHNAAKASYHDGAQYETSYTNSALSDVASHSLKPLDQLDFEQRRMRYELEHEQKKIELDAVREKNKIDIAVERA